MLYFLHGTDTDKARAKAREMLANLHQKKPEAEVFRLDSDSWSEARFDELIAAQGLFEKKFIVFASRLFENKEAKETVMKKLSAVGGSENIFIFLEGAVDKAALAAVAEVAEKIQSFEKAVEKKARPFNIFSLADALGGRDRKTLWVVYQKALRSGAAPEELSGILFWQVKNLMLARQSASAQAAGLNPFVFQKARRYGDNFSPAELKNLALRLISIYHDAHRGLLDFEAGLERFILSL